MWEPPVCYMNLTILFALMKRLVRYNLFDWQSLQPYSGPNQQFYQFCDALEVDTDGTVAPASGFGLDHALQAWGAYLTNTYLPASTFFI